MKGRLVDLKAKLKEATEENETLQDKVLELKSSYMNQHGVDAPVGGLQEFERSRMQQAIDELSDKCRMLREEKKKLDAENNFFHMSTTIFIKLKPIMETEKQLCYQLAELNLQQDDEEYLVKHGKLEETIKKCREAITVMEVKLKKVLDRVKKAQNSKV